MFSLQLIETTERQGTTLIDVTTGERTTATPFPEQFIHFTHCFRELPADKISQIDGSSATRETKP